MIYGDDLEIVEVLKLLIMERFGCEVFIVNIIGVVIGVYIGFGVIMLFFLNEVE